MLALPLFLDVQTTERAHAVIEAIDRALSPYESAPAPFLAVRKVGQPYVNTYLDNDTRTSGYKYFPLFMLFVIVLNWLLYRSFRALFAFVADARGVRALTVGFIGVTGGTLTIVSPMVPMTILVTATATLVYIHSRFVEGPAGRPDRRAPSVRVDQQVRRLHRVDLRHRGRLRGIDGVQHPAHPRDRASGLPSAWCFTWVTVFTLFPALQKVLRTPTEQERDRRPVVGTLRRVVAALHLSLALAARRARWCSARSARSRCSASRASRADGAADRAGRVHGARPRRCTRTSGGCSR